MKQLYIEFSVVSALERNIPDAGYVSAGGFAGMLSATLLLCLHRNPPDVSGTA